MFGKLRLGYLVLFAVSALVLSAAFWIGDKPPQYFIDVTRSRGRLVIYLLPIALWISWLGILVIARRTDRPTATIYRTFRRRRWWLLRGTLLSLLVVPLALAFSVIKQAIPETVPFYADPAFAYADRILFLGTDPWRITHALFGPFSTLLIDRFYLLWFPVMFCMTAWFNFTRDMKFQLQGLLSFSIGSVILGNFMAMILSSVGPCFYELYYQDLHFRPMMDTLRADDGIYDIKAFAVMEWLYENREKSEFGAGISAMPSIHVAIAHLLFLAVRQKSSKGWVRGLAGFYVAAIWIGSIHLGWHYAVDGLVSVVVMWVIWWATGKFVAWLDRDKELPATVAEPNPRPPLAAGAHI